VLFLLVWQVKDKSRTREQSFEITCLTNCFLLSGEFPHHRESGGVDFNVVELWDGGVVAWCVDGCSSMKSHSGAEGCFSLRSPTEPAGRQGTLWMAMEKN
jgi:hypothetical protein